MSSKSMYHDTILDLVRRYHDVAFPKQEFIPGKTFIPTSGRVFDAEEIVSLVESALEFWLTAGHYCEEFERGLVKVFGLRCASLVNSGSSANLLALTALTSPELGDQRLRPGDEVITTATGFPTTVNPIFQNNLVPVFVDTDVSTCNIDVKQLEKALSPKTKAIMLAHTLGNPFDLGEVMDFANGYNLRVVEDCCDALGSLYNGHHVGQFGDLATLSLYAAHHINCGEGGCVLTDRPRLQKIVESFRDWGRHCWCATGSDNTCGKRFNWQLGDLPKGYDHKHSYHHIGYNLKMTDMQAAIGVAQLKKLDSFGAARKRNFERLYAGLEDLTGFFMLPMATPNSEPCWFGFPLTVLKGPPFTRRDVVQYLDRHQIGSRHIFAGNLVRQPAYQGHNFRVVGDLAGADFIMNNSFWIGVYPGLTDQMIDYMIEILHNFIKEKA